MGRKRPATSPAAWLLDMLEGPLASARIDVVTLAESYASRAVRRGGRWVVVIGDHTERRHVRHVRAVDLAALACAPGRALLAYDDAAALLDDGIPACRLQPLADPASNCGDDGAQLAIEALGYLARAGYAAVRVHAGTHVTGVITVPNTRA